MASNRTVQTILVFLVTTLRVHVSIEQLRLDALFNNNTFIPPPCIP